MPIPTLQEVHQRIQSIQADPLAGLRQLRDQIAGEMAGLEANGLTNNATGRRQIADQIVALICPPTAEDERARLESLQRAADEHAANAVELARTKLKSENPEALDHLAS